MRYILLAFLSMIQLSALDIYLNSAKERDIPYAILHLVDKEPIECQTIELALGKREYICKLNKVVKNKIGKKILKLVKIDFLERKRDFYIKIEPTYNSNIFSVKEKLYKSEEVMDEKEVKKSKHWAILLDEKPIFGEKIDTDGINFPIIYDSYLKPSIGAVDLNGAPISYVKSKDINYYLDVQKEFKDMDFDDVVKDVDRALKRYPNSIFKSDLLLYKIKAIDICLEKNIQPISDKYENSDLIKMAKKWIREFSSNEGIPQALLILVKSYLRAESNSDVNYFLDILVTEHKDSPYTKKAILYFADSLYDKNEKDRAMKLYEDVLYSAKDLDIASQAAIRLASSKINEGKAKEAKEYLIKVLKANKSYLLKDRDATSKLATKLASNGLEEIAATLNDLLLKNLPEGDLDTRERLLKQAGDWYTKADDINRAYARYMEYKRLYKDGLYIDEVNRAIDRLFFKLNETNETKLVNYYDKLISKYDNDIKDKAIIEKAKLLLKQKKYQEVLDMRSQLKEAQDKNSTQYISILKSAAVELIDRYISQKSCHDAVRLLEENHIEPTDIENREYLFKCFLETSRYKKAEKLAEQELKTKDLKKKFLWLEGLLVSNYKLQKYDKVLELKSDIFKLSEIINKPIEPRIYRVLFNSMYYKKQFNQALSMLDIIDKNSPKNVKNLELYNKIVEYANSIKNDILLIKYAKKILDMERFYKLDYYSPKVDFLYIDSLKRLSKIEEAKEIASGLLKLKLKQSDSARVFYELGELNLKLKMNSDAKKWFSKCSKVKSPNPWSSLCTEALKIF